MSAPHYTATFAVAIMDDRASRRGGRGFPQTALNADMLDKMAAILNALACASHHAQDRALSAALSNVWKIAYNMGQARRSDEEEVAADTKVRAAYAVVAGAV